MVENDIYNSEARYLRLRQNIKGWTFPAITGKRKYWIKAPENCKYFDAIIAKSEAKDISYIRRVRLLQGLLVICHVIPKDLATADRKDIDELLTFAHTVKRTYESKKSFMEDIRHLWKILFPEKDHLGREDETLTPYVVRHIKTEPDKSRKKIRKDKQSIEEVAHVFELFFDRVDVQVALSLAYEGLARPQEILERKISDVELHDSYAKVWITEHGKEGTGFIPLIENVEYLKKWLLQHPLRNNPDAPLFFSHGANTMFKKITPAAMNKTIRKRIRAAGIDKPLTMYSFKRNGVTHLRQRGYSDNAIQHRARWTSTDQLQTYDLGNQDDAFRVELEKRGLLAPTLKEKPGRPVGGSFKREAEPLALKQKPDVQKFCTGCGSPIGSADRFCGGCGVTLEQQYAPSLVEH